MTHEIKCDTVTMSSSLDEIVDYFLKCGYTKVRVNIWKQRRIYVELNDSRIMFCYELDNNFHIWSKEPLPRKVYRDAAHFLSFFDKKVEV